MTLNAGLLRINLLGGLKVIEPSPWVHERARALPGVLRAHPADVLFLQEIYEPAHKAELAQQLADLYPHAAYFSDRRGMRLLPDSLMILSRHPLSDVAFTRFEAGRWDERLLDTKGLLRAVAAIPDWGRVLLINVHTTAGLFTHPEDRRIDAVRDAQLRQVDAEARSRGAGIDRVLLAGDFNCGPPASVGNYELLAELGYVDAYGALGLPERPTWSPVENVLNRSGEHAAWGCPPQRIDHVLFERDCAQPNCGGIFLEEEVVLVDDGTRVPVSDHYGVWVDLMPLAKIGARGRR